MSTNRFKIENTHSLAVESCPTALDQRPVSIDKTIFFMTKTNTNPDVNPSPRQPKAATNSDGQPRVVGVEVEFGGLDLDQIMTRIQSVVGGEVQRRSNYEGKVRGTPIGDIAVELDAQLFTKMKVRGVLDKLGLDNLQPNLGANVEKLMASEARRFVPFEIVFAPVEIGRLPEVDAVCAAFREDAEGTGASVLNAFGLHLNPELPRVDAGTVLRYLRAFLCLYDELKTAHQVDVARAMSPFIDAFSKDYTMRVLDPDYAPDTAALIDDYIDDNPTRNRPLDLLPVFAWLDEERVTRRLPEEKIGRRPAFHYRLPNSRIDEADWSVTREWNIWMRVEDLANDDDALGAAMSERIQALRGPIERLINWINPAS